MEEYDSNGDFVRSFGEKILKYAKDITVANDGRVLVVDTEEDSPYISLAEIEEHFVIHTFGEHGDHLNKFELQLNDFVYTSITFHPASEHVVVAGRGPERHFQVKIYSKDGKFVRSVQIQNCDEFFDVRGITVNNDGHIAVVTRNVFLW